MLNLYYGRCCCPYSTMWLMLFPLVCWNWVKCETSMAGVIANVADGMATVKSMFIGWCYCQCGRWYSHLMNIVGWQMLLPSVADGITTNCTCNIYGRCYSLGGLDVSESFKRTCSRYGVQVHLKGGLTIKNLLMAPKDKDTIMKKSAVIYRYKCNRVECNEEYIGESARNFAERFKEHLKTPLPHPWPFCHLWSQCHNWQLWNSGERKSKPP